MTRDAVKHALRSMTTRTAGCGIALAMLCAAAPALADDSIARALRERQQQSDAFALQLQQSIQSFRAGALSPQQRLEFDSLQRDQRMRQGELFYRQELQQRQTQQTVPSDNGLRRAETMRFEQERQAQQQRFAGEAAQELSRPQPAKPNPQPAPN